jgi:hypothetical protein
MKKNSKNWQQALKTMDRQIEPIVIRPKKNRYELIAGERRLPAVKKYITLKTIQAKIIDVDDLQARRISAAENSQWEYLAVVKSIEAIVEIPTHRCLFSIRGRDTFYYKTFLALLTKQMKLVDTLCVDLC